MKILNRLLAVAFALGVLGISGMISGCATVTTPVLKHETGECLGSGHFRVSGRFEMGRIYAALPEDSPYTGVPQTTSVFNGQVLGINAAAGIIKKVDVQLGSFLSFGGGGWRVGLKYQHKGGPLYGSSPGNFAVAGIIGYGRFSAKGSQEFQSGSELVNVSQTLSAYNLDISFPVSYRLTKNVIVYAGLNYYHSGLTGSADDDFVEYDSNDLSVNAGFKLNIQTFEAGLEIAVLRAYDPFEDYMRYLPYIGISGGIVF